MGDAPTLLPGPRPARAQAPSGRAAPHSGARHGHLSPAAASFAYARLPTPRSANGAAPGPGGGGARVISAPLAPPLPPRGPPGAAPSSAASAPRPRRRPRRPHAPLVMTLLTAAARLLGAKVRPRRRLKRAALGGGT